MRKHPHLEMVGNKIRLLRENKGYSQEDFATDAGFDRSYYGGVERGERNISAINLIKIAHTLNVEIGDLFPQLSSLRRKSMPK